MPIILDLTIFDPVSYLTQSAKPSQISVNVKLAFYGFAHVEYCAYKTAINLTRAMKQAPPDPPSHTSTHTHAHSDINTFKVTNVSWDLLHLCSGLVHVPVRADEVLWGCHGDLAAPQSL